MSFRSPARCELHVSIRIEGWTYHFNKLGILHHHSVNDPEEGFVAREKTRSAGESVPLEHTLAGMFGEDLNDASAFATALRVPLEVAPRVFEYSIELVRYQLVGGEDAESLRVPSKEGSKIC
jgi:hypothetical protein